MSLKKTVLILGILTPLLLLAPSPAQSAQSAQSGRGTIDSTALPKSEIKEIVDTMLERRLKQDIKGYINDAVSQQFQSFKWILAIFGLGGSTLIVAYITNRLKDMVSQELEKRSDNITQGLEFLKFNTSTTKIHLNLDLANALNNMNITSSIIEADLESILSYLRGIDPSSKFRHTPEFRSGLLDTMRLLISNTESALIDELFDKYQAEIFQDTHLLIGLLDHYGQDIIGDGTPRDEDSRSYQRFKILEGYAPTKGYPEIALAYRTLYESEKTRLRGEISPIQSVQVIDCISKSKHLSEQDQRLYIRKLLRLSKYSNWCTGGFQAKNIESTVRFLFRTYQGALFDAYQLGNDESTTIATEGLNLEEADALLSRLFSRSGI